MLKKGDRVKIEITPETDKDCSLRLMFPGDTYAEGTCVNTYETKPGHVTVAFQRSDERWGEFLGSYPISQLIIVENSEEGQDIH